VAVHNDYRSNGRLETYWLFIHPNGRYAEGSGETDAEALRAVWLQPAVSRSLAPPPEGEGPNDKHKWDSTVSFSEMWPDKVLSALPLMWAAIDRWNKHNGINITHFDVEILRAAYLDQCNAVKAALEGCKQVSQGSVGKNATESPDNAGRDGDINFVPHVNTLDEEIRALDDRDRANRRAREEGLLSVQEIDDLVAGMRSPFQLARDAAAKQLEKVRKRHYGENKP